MCLVALASSVFAFAQEPMEPLEYTSAGLDVCGVEIGQKLPHSEFVAKFGKPDRYRSYETEFGLDEDYYYGQNWFHCSGGGYITNYSLQDSRFAALTKDIEGGIRVKDEFKKMLSYKYGEMRYRETDNDGNEVYALYSDIPFIMLVKNGIIVSIICDYPV